MTIYKRATKAIRRAGIEHIEVLKMNIHLEATEVWPEFICKALPVDTREVLLQRAKCFVSWRECMQAVLAGYRPVIEEDCYSLAKGIW